MGAGAPPPANSLPLNSPFAFLFSPKTTPRNPSLQPINNARGPLIFRKVQVSWPQGSSFAHPPCSGTLSYVRFFRMPRPTSLLSDALIKRQVP